jgi:thioesterase domain-containing protein
MDPELDKITKYIHDHIPITFHLGVKVKTYDGRSVVLFAPIAPNLNHRNTAFGGSLSAVAILSGWALLHLKLKEHGIRSRLVIQKSSFEFSDPIDEDFDATCSMPSNDLFEKFLRSLKKYRKARIQLKSKITSASGKAGLHEGTYVAVIPGERETL